jgi:hypothetical protein
MKNQDKFQLTDKEEVELIKKAVIVLTKRRCTCGYHPQWIGGDLGCVVFMRWKKS